MTNILPYGAQNNERAIENSIRKGQLPADVSSIVLPEAVQFIHHGCWRQDPTARRDVVLWHATLQFATAALFKRFLDIPLSQVPPKYNVQRDGWNIVRNPDSQIHHEYESVRGSHDVLYVI